MDEIDTAQQVALDRLDVLARANSAIDGNQQKQIDRMTRVQNILLWLTAASSLAQIVECIKVLTWK